MSGRPSYKTCNKIEYGCVCKCVKDERFESAYRENQIKSNETLEKVTDREEII